MELSRQVRIERVLCCVVILCKLIYLWTHWGILSGYDMGDLLLRVEESDWWKPAPSLRTVYFGYHPPLGFMLAHLVQSLGVTSVHAVQIVATTASIAAFLFLRQSLSALKLLARNEVIFFLYFVAGLPLIVHSGASMNQDILIYALSALALWLSIELWGRNEPLPRIARIATTVVLLLELAAGMLVKFSGLLICAIPLLVGICLPQLDAHRFRKSAATCLLILGACGLVFPYYWQRYYQAEGTFFPQNDSYFYPEQLAQARASRDADLWGFFGRYLAPTLIEPPGTNPAERDLKQVRLSQTWRDFWLKDTQLRPTDKTEEAEAAAVSLKLGTAYWALGGIGFCIGVVIWFRQIMKRERGTWNRLGFVLAGYSAVLIAALTKFYYSDPLADNAIAKGIYIMPVGWLIGFAVSKLAGAISERALFPILFAWVLINHLLPVY